MGTRTPEWRPVRHGASPSRASARSCQTLPGGHRFAPVQDRARACQVMQCRRDWNGRLARASKLWTDRAPIRFHNLHHRLSGKDKFTSTAINAFIAPAPQLADVNDGRDKDWEGAWYRKHLASLS